MDLSKDQVEIGDPQQIEGGIVWEEAAAAMGGPVLCTEWAGLKARVGQAIVPSHGPCIVLHLGPFDSEYDAKMFAEQCLKARFFSKVQSGEAEPMPGHTPYLKPEEK